MSELYTVKEAARELGYKGESALYHLAYSGTITFAEQDGRKMVTAEDLEKLRARRQGSIPVETPVPVKPVDAIAEAIAGVEAALKLLRKAIRQHEREVRRDAIGQFVESLREGIR